MNLVSLTLLEGGCSYGPLSSSSKMRIVQEAQCHQIGLKSPESSYITLSTLDLPARLKDLNKQLEKNIADAAKFTEKTKPGKIENNKQEHKRLKEEIDFLQEKVDAGNKTVPLSGTLVLEFGKTSESVM